MNKDRNVRDVVRGGLRYLRGVTLAVVDDEDDMRCMRGDEGSESKNV